jgi:hypothetical protein
VSAGIREVTIEDTIFSVKGGPPLLRRRAKIKLHDQIRALEALGRHLGLFDRARGDPDSLEERVKRMTPQERHAFVAQTLEEADRRYAYTLLEDQTDEGQKELTAALP